MIYSLLHASSGSYGNALIADKAGDLYGTASGGGSKSFGGTAFRLSPPTTASGAWTETTLYQFSMSGSGGYDPVGGLVLGPKGQLFGTTQMGGTGHGVVFELTPPQNGQVAWTETVLHSFAGPDGTSPTATLLLDSHGALYGTTSYGGAAGSAGGHGLVFKLTPPVAPATMWVETILYKFTGGRDGSCPYAGLLADSKSSLYGTTLSGGSGKGCNSTGCGVAFELSPPTSGHAAWKETVLHSFSGGNDGAEPWANLVADASGKLFGTTQNGGAASFGTVFELTPPVPGKTAWTETVIHSFTSSPDGDSPDSPVVLGADGVLFGTTYGGGPGNKCSPNEGCGIVYALTPPAAGQTQWTETTLHRFANGVDGGNPLAGLTAANGILFGTTQSGGADEACRMPRGCGTVFEVTP